MNNTLQLNWLKIQEQIYIYRQDRRECYSVDEHRFARCHAFGWKSFANVKLATKGTRFAWLCMSKVTRREQMKRSKSFSVNPWWRWMTSHLPGLVEETAASSLLEEAQILVYTAARELPGQVITKWYKNERQRIIKIVSGRKNMLICRPKFMLYFYFLKNGDEVGYF